MSIPIEGLVELGTNQEKNSTPSKRYRLINGTILNSFSQGGRLKRWSSGLSSVGLFLATACGSPVRAGESPSVPEATATAFTEVNPDVVPQANIPGVGKVGVSTPEPATAGNPPKESSTPVANPEVKKGFDCGILSPEACVLGLYAQWNVTPDRKASGIVFILKKGEQIIIPEELQVATDEYPQPHTYSGRRITGISQDGKRLTFIGDITAAEGLTNTGKKLPAGTLVGTIAGSGKTVFNEAPYNLVVLSSEEDRNKRFPDQMVNPPKIVDNIPTVSIPPGGLTFFDVPPPPNAVIVPRNR